MTVRSIALATIWTLCLACLCGTAMATPGAPAVTWPANASLCGSNRPDIIWAGDAHTAYEVHVGSNNVPTSNDGWDSGVVWDSGSLAMCGSLAPGSTYYIYIRLLDATGWGPWSAAGVHFYTGGQLLNDPYDVGDPIPANGMQWPHRICYNADLNQYLVVFNDVKPGMTRVVSYYLLDGNGERASGEFSIAHSMDGTLAAGVAYDSVHHEYLVAFSGWDDENTPNEHNELWVRRVRASDGVQLGSSILIRNAGTLYDNTLPLSGVSYSPASDMYYLAWRELSGGQNEIYATRLAGGTGAPVGSIVNLTASVPAPSVMPYTIYNPAADEFFVIYSANNWQASPATGFDYYGQRVRASDGQLMGSPIVITNGAESEWHGNVSYDSDLNRYLVVYERMYDGASIWGQFVRADGTLIHPDGAVLSSPDPFIILDEASTGLRCWGPQAEWNPNTKEYLVCFCDAILYSDYARRISENGATIGLPFDITGGVLGIGNWLPTPLWNPVSGEFIITWYNGYDDVYTRRYKTWPVPAPDITPPGAVTGLSVTPADQRNTISWTNPSTSDFAGTMVRFAIGGYPNSAADGQLLVDAPNAPGSTDSFTHVNLNGGTTYYYAAFAYDEVPNYAASAKATGTPAGPRIMATSAFNSGADGWSTSVWKSGALDPGTIGWNSSAGNSGGGMRCTGSGATDNDTRDTREGAEIWKTITTAHFQGIKVSYDLRVSSLGSAYYGAGSGSTSIPVDHNDVQEQLTVFYSTDAGANWTEAAPWLGRDTLLGYLTYGSRQIDLSGIPACGNNASFALKFRWQLNTASDTCDLDNIVISGSQMETTQPTISVTFPTSDSSCPSNVTPFHVSGEASDNVGVTQVTWSSNRGGSGSCSVSLPGDRTVNWGGDVTLLSGQNMLTFRASDAAGNVRSVTLMIVYCPDPSVTIGNGKMLADNVLAYLSSKVVTAVYGDNFYVEEPGRSAGVKVKPVPLPTGLAVGKTVDCGGSIKTETNGDRYWSGSAIVTGDAGGLSPLGMSSRSLGGSNWFYNSGTGAGQRGIEGGIGLSNLGLLVTVWGKVTQRDTTGLQYFYVDDGFGAVDGTQTAGVTNVGVRVNANPTSYAAGSCVSVTGVSSCFKDTGGRLRWQVLPRTDGIRLFAP